MARLEIVRTGSRGDRIAICVHGIFSDHSTFAPMLERFIEDRTLAEWDLAWFDYDFHQEMPDSGRQLAVELERLSRRYQTIVLVAHSMGGLVSRFAILDRPLDRVTRLIMLGTPNCGAVRTQGLSWLAQATMHAAGKLYGLFTRRTGVRDLTRVTKLFRTYRSNWHRATHVEYITIPGLFYHLDRSIFDAPKTFNTVEAATELVTAMQPLFRVALQRPHDGIVEEASNRLAPSEEGSRWSEKKAAINYPERDTGAGYAHIRHEDCADLTHVEIHVHRPIIAIVGQLIAAESYQVWRQHLSANELIDIKVEPGPDGRW